MSLEKIQAIEVSEYRPSSLSESTYIDISADFIKGSEVCLTINEYRPTANDAVAKIIDYIIYAICNKMNATTLNHIRAVTSHINDTLARKGICVGKIDRPTQMRFSLTGDTLTVKARYL